MIIASPQKEKKIKGKSINLEIPTILNSPSFLISSQTRESLRFKRTVSFLNQFKYYFPTF